MVHFSIIIKKKLGLSPREKCPRLPPARGARLKCRTWGPRPTRAAVRRLRAPSSTTAAPCSAWRPTRPPTSRTSAWSSSSSRARSCARCAPPHTRTALSLAPRTPRAHGPRPKGPIRPRYLLHRPLRTACPRPPRTTGAAHERRSHRRGPAGDLAARRVRADPAGRRGRAAARPGPRTLCRHRLTRRGRTPPECAGPSAQPAG